MWSLTESVCTMEFHEKLQELRKRKGLTQEELAERLYVSRSAVSKWESGRGYPNIDSLKAIATLFSVTIDDLLSGDEVLTIAEEDYRQKEIQFRSMVFGLLDFSIAMFFFLPFFGQNSDGMIHAVSLLSLTVTESYLQTVYFGIIVGMIALGILTLALQNCRQVFWMQNKEKLSFLLNAIGTLLFIISSQPYAAAYLLILMVIKVQILIKKQ